MSRRPLIAPPVLAVLLALLAAATGAAETVQQDGVRLAFRGAISPPQLPRSRPAPARISLRAGIGGVGGASLPRLRQLEIALTRAVRIDASGLPVCHLDQVQPASTADARAACGGSLVGGGRFSASVQIPEQAPYPSRGRIDAFSGRYRGRPAILLHVYGTDPIPASYTLPLTIGRGGGEFGLVLRTSLVGTTPSAGRVTGISLALGASYAYRGRRHSYLSATCPAPRGARFAAFPFARTRLGFADRAVELTVRRSCRVSEPASG
ncbi:MAG: hypothetical protein AB7V58_04315 [Solirubrobacterales bacterium]